MKDWQHNIEMDYLLKIEKFYSRYNKYAMGPFTEMKKNRIASGLHKKTLKIYTQGAMGKGEPIFAFDSSLVSTRTPITMFPNGPVVGCKQRGDRVVKNITWEQGKKESLAEVMTMGDESVWAYVWAEDKEANKMLTNIGYDYVGSKVTSFGELFSIYFYERGVSTILGHREHPTVDPEELYTFVKVPTVGPQYIDDLREAIETRLDLDYTNHYSNYNTKNTWSALSLRGYLNDPTFITKPVEMNKKWKEEHKDTEFELQDTPLRRTFGDVLENILDITFPGVSTGETKLHRIRFMRLTKDGKLGRHTDQVDPDLGVKNGSVMRFHLPIVTNSFVKFSCWRPNGTEDTVVMKKGELWYLDIRKPHMAINEGQEERIHLVVDVEANEMMRELLRDGKNTF